MNITLINEEFDRLGYLIRQINFARESIASKLNFYYNNIAESPQIESCKEDSLREEDKIFIEDEIYKLCSEQKHFIRLIENIPIIEENN